MSRILDVIDRMIYDINLFFPELGAERAFKGEFADEPVLKKAVYVSAGEVRTMEADFLIYVYAPASDGGFECVKTACEVHNLLYERGFEMKDVKVGNTEFDKKVRGFFVKLQGTVTDESLSYTEEIPEEPEPEKTFPILINGRDTGSRSFCASSVKTVLSCESYPIREVFEEEPIEYIKDKISYKITLGGCPSDEARALVEGKRFSLSIVDTGEVFVNCVCEKCTIDAESGLGECVAAGEKLIG